MRSVKTIHCYESREYVKMVTGKTMRRNPTLDEVEDMELEEWNYDVREMDEVLENELDVVMVRFPLGNGKYEFRLCEVILDQKKKKLKKRKVKMVVKLWDREAKFI